MSEAIEQFAIRIDDSVLDDLRERLERTRFPDQIEGVGWDYGIPMDYLRTLVDYWLRSYDWRAQEDRLNRYSHYRTTIDGQSIHFLHARSPHPDAFPLVMTHGWPGSIVEFLAVIPRLTHPEDHGGRAADAFHVVAPSLPGYGFSEPTRTPAGMSGASPGPGPSSWLAWATTVTAPRAVTGAPRSRCGWPPSTRSTARRST